MNISSGGLSFDFSATNDNLRKIVEQSKKDIQGLADAAKTGGARMDAAFKQASDKLDTYAAKIGDDMSEQRQAVMALEKEIETLKAKSDQAFLSGDNEAFNQTNAIVKAKEQELASRKKTIQACYDALDVLDKEREQYEEIRKGSEEAAKAQASLRAQLKRIINELAQLKAAQTDGTADAAMLERMKELEEEAGRISDALSDARQATGVFSDDNAGISGVVEGFGGLAGAISAAQGTMALFGVENEKVEQAMLRVQSLMAVTTGLQQVANALNKDSAFQLVVVRKAKLMLASAEMKLATATGISAAAARAWVGAITLGLSVAVGWIIYFIEKFRTASAEAAEFNKKMAETASEPIGKIELLAEKWRRLGSDMAAKKRFIEDNKKAFDELGVSIRDVVDAENLLINNKDAFIKAQIEKAKAAVYIEQQKDAIENLIKEESKLPEVIAETEEARRRALTFLEENGYDAYYTSYNEAHRIPKEQAIQNINAACDAQIQAHKDKLAEMEAEITSGYRKAADAEERGLRILKDASIEAMQDGREAADAFTTYILHGTDKAEANLNTFGSRVRSYFDNLISQLRGSSNSFGNFFGNLLGKLFGDNSNSGSGLGDGTIGDRIDKIRARYYDAKKKLSELRAPASTASVGDIRAMEEDMNKMAELYKTITGLSIEGSATGGSRANPVDRFAQELNSKKALYQKYLDWKTSSDKTVSEAADTEFAPLLQEGNNYLDYLQRQQQALMDAAPTAAITAKLKIVQDQIAEVTKEAALRDFQAQLEKDLQACTTLGAMLDLLEQRRQAIADDPTEVGDRKRDMIKEQEDGVKEQVQSETEALLQQYASYELERLKFAESYARKRELLEKNLAAATTEAQRATAQAALDGLEEENRKWQRGKSALYISLLDEYKSHQQQLSDIQARYARQRAEAEANGDFSMVQMINRKEREEVSRLAANQLMASETWNQLFSDISRLSTTTISNLLKKIEAHKLTLSAQLNPADLKAVNDQLERARREIRQRNPFLALRDSLAELRQAMTDKKLLSDKDDPILLQLEDKKKTYETIAANLADPLTAPTVAVDFKSTLDEGADFIDYLKRRIQALQGQKIELGAEFTGQHELDVLIAMLNKVQGTGKSVGQGLKDSFADVASSIQLIAGCFDAVVGGMKKMGIQMDEETEAILDDIDGIMEGAQGVAQGIATDNPLSIIQGSINLFSSAFDIFNSRDRKAEKSIRSHQEALGKLKNAYNELEDAVKRALGEEVYRNQTALIANLRRQQGELQGMIADEQGKKHTDRGKIEEWKEQYKELGRQIEDIIEEITQSITQTNVKDLAGDLADALVEAFKGGEDAAKAFGDVADDVIKKAVINALKLQLLEKPLQNAIKQLQRDMGFDEEGNGTFDGLTESEQKRFKQAVEAAGANFEKAMEMYRGLFEQLDGSDPTTLSGAIKGASQESIDLLAGQTNAVRQNQVTSLAILRSQLQHLSNIDANVGVIAGRLLSILNAITGPAGTSLRSQGITD